MAKKKKTDQSSSDELIIKRYGNRRLYNTQTRSYVNYHQLAELVRDGADIRVIDSTSKEDVTKAVLIQVILEEEKNKKTILPTEFLFQLLRSREESVQDFFKNHLAASFNAKAKDFTGKVAAPSQPVNLTATQRGRMIHLAWLPSSDKDAVEYEIRRGSTTDTWSTMARIAKTRSQEWFDEPPIGTFRYEVRSTDGIRYSDFGASSTATVFFFGPAGDVEEGTKAFYVDVDTFDMELHGDTWMGAPLSVKSPLVIEGVKTGKMTFLLANNSVGSIFGAPADADAFIASANLDSVQEYEDLWHAPFRKGPDGVVQPLWAPIQGSLVQSIFSNEVWGGDGLGYRNANFKFRLNGQTLRVGYDSPEVHTRIEVKNEFSGDVGVEVTDPEGLDASLGIELATSIGGTFSQTLFKCDKATAFGWKREQHVASIVPPTDYTTDSNGHAIVTYPEPMQPGQVPHLTVQVLNGVSATWTIESLDHATAVVRARNPSTGATLAGVVLRISADDHGGGGSTYQLAAADDPNPLP